MRWLQWNLEKIVLTGFACTLVILSLVGVMYYQTTTRIAQPDIWRKPILETLQTLESLRAQLLQAEGSHLRYILSGDENCLQNCNDALRQGEEAIIKLRGFDTMNLPQRMLNSLESFLQQEKESIATQAGLFKTGGVRAVTPLFAKAEDNMLHFSSLISEIEIHERNLLNKRDEEVRRAAQTSFMVIGFGGVLVFLLLATSGFILHREIKQRQAAENELRRTDGLLSSVIENIPAMIFLKDAKDLRFALFNKAGEEVLGYSREELLGRNDYDFFPKDRADFFTAGDREVLSHNSVVDIPEEVIETKHKGSCILHTRKIPLRNPAGEPEYLLGISEDITERKKTEDQIKSLHMDLEQRASDLEDANKELEAFSYSVSHDLRAPLRHIDGFVDLLQKRSVGSLDEDNQRYLNIIADAAKHMGILIDELLVFSRMGRSGLEKTKINMGLMVQEALQDLQPGIEGRRISWKIGALNDVYGDPLMIRLVLVNLISNALKYTRPREEAQIEIGSWVQEQEAVFFVRDNGVGFDMHYVDKLFGVFQRLHRSEDFEGTGIGLANVRRIISRHGGKTWAEGAVDKGASFYFTFPIQTKG